MHWRNIAPFCRDDDPQTGPTIRFPATSRHSGLTKVSTTESHGRGRKESLKFILSHSAAQRCVHALAPARGRQRRVIASSSPEGMNGECDSIPGKHRLPRLLCLDGLVAHEI